MVKLNKTCCVCGSQYSYCPSCGGAKKPSWMASFCSENCKKVYEAAAAFNMKKMNAEEARVILDTCDLSNQSHFTAATQRLLGEIYIATEVKEIEPIKIYSIEEQPLVESASLQTIEITDEMVERAVATVNNLSKQNNYKKKKKKRKNDR